MTLFELAASIINVDEKINTQFVSLTENTLNLSKAIKNIIEYNSPFISLTENIFSLQEAIKTIIEINSPEYENKQIESFIKWAQYGWTYNNSTSICEFDNPPNSLLEANEYMNRYCTVQSIKEMKNAIEKKGICNSDLEEAYFCFNNKKYKASTLIVFTILDKVLILHNKTQTNKKGEIKKKVGSSAVKAIQNDEEKLFENSFLFAFLTFSNIMECLSKLYEYGDDFNKQPEIINRNFLSHGMYEKEISMLDCYKVWSALYSLAVIYPKVKNTIENINHKGVLNV